MGTTLIAMLFSGGRAALTHIGDSRAFGLRGGQLRPITKDHTIRNLVIDEDLLAPTLPRHLDGRADRSADMGLPNLRADGRYLLFTGGLSPVVDDRPHRNVLISRRNREAPASWPP
jgi:PPM family protein phosphatase